MRMTRFRRTTSIPRRLAGLGIAVIACGLMSGGLADAATTPTSTSTTTTKAASTTKKPSAASSTTTSRKPTTSTNVKSRPQSTFKAEVWADNWFKMSVNGSTVGEDSVPITTERSFNAETFTFAARYPLTIAIEAKDFKENDSGLEYIGQNRQQMGDGGIIAQITDTTTGKVVAVTNSAWKSLVIHRAPLNTVCEKDRKPETTCKFEALEAPGDWTRRSFDDRSWKQATLWSAADVDPKDGYRDISWHRAAKFIWGTDLHVDNTVLLRLTVAGSEPVA